MAIASYSYEDKEYYKILIRRRDKDGKRIRQSCNTDKNGNRIKCLDLAKNIEQSLKDESQCSYNLSQTVTWKMWHEVYLNRMKDSLKPNTYFLYDDCIQNWIPSSWNQIPLAHITQDDILNLLSQIEGQNKKNSIFKRIRKILSLAEENQVISHNPAQNIAIEMPFQKINVLNNAQSELLLDNANYYNHPFYYHWALSILTGIKNSELYPLCWNNINFKNNTISIVNQWTSKDGLKKIKDNYKRTIPISKDVAKILRELENMGAFSENISMENNCTKKTILTI